YCLRPRSRASATAPRRPACRAPRTRARKSGPRSRKACAPRSEGRGTRGTPPRTARASSLEVGIIPRRRAPAGTAERKPFALGKRRDEFGQPELAGSRDSHTITQSSRSAVRGDRGTRQGKHAERQEQRAEPDVVAVGERNGLPDRVVPDPCAVLALQVL